MVKVYITRRRGRLSLCWREGKRIKYKAPTSQDPVQAEIDRRKHQDELTLGIADPYAKWRKTTIFEHLDAYHAERAASGRMTAKQVKEIDQQARRVFMAAHIQFVHEITEHKIETAVLALRRHCQSKKPKDQPRLSARSRNQHRKACIQVCRWLVRSRRVRDNPLTALVMENQALDPKHPRGILSDDEFAKLLEATAKSTKVVEGADARYRLRLYRLAALTGFRKGDLASLTRRSFRLDGPIPVVIVSAGDSKHREEDTQPLHPESVAELCPWLDSLEPDEPLFENLHQRKTEEMVKADLAAAKVPYVLDGKFRDFHAIFRHGFITKLWGAGVQASPLTIMKLARHKDLKTTLRYSHSALEEQAAALSKLPGVGAQKPKRRGKAG